MRKLPLIVFVEFNWRYLLTIQSYLFVGYGLKKAKDNGFEWVALTGGDYYAQFGFESALKYGIVLSNNHLRIFI